MRYIKARKETAAHLGLLGSRNVLPDGNYLLWDRDVARLQGSGTLEELLPQIGAVELTAAAARAEQNGGTPAELPEVTLEAITGKRATADEGAGEAEPESGSVETGTVEGDEP